MMAFAEATASAISRREFCAPLSHIMPDAQYRHKISPNTMRYREYNSAVTAPDADAACARRAKAQEGLCAVRARRSIFDAQPMRCAICAMIFFSRREAAAAEKDA